MEDCCKKCKQPVKDFIMPCGKYKDMSLDDIYSEDPDYLEWIIDTFDDGNVKSRVEQYMEGK